MTDLARELEVLLPCSGSPPHCDEHDPARCTPCHERPAITTYVQRKLDEADELRRGAEYDAGCLRADLDEARADGELLAKVGWLLPRRGQIEIRLDVYGDWYARSVLIEHPASVRHGGGAPTLAEALRKLVGGES